MRMFYYYNLFRTRCIFQNEWECGTVEVLQLPCFALSRNKMHCRPLPSFSYKPTASTLRGSSPESRTKSTLWPVRLKDPGTLCLPTCLLPGLPHTPLPKDPLQPFSSWPPLAYGLPDPVCLPVLVWETIVVTCRSDPAFLPVSSKPLQQNLRGSGLHNWIRIMENRERIQSRAKKSATYSERTVWWHLPLTEHLREVYQPEHTPAPGRITPFTGEGTEVTWVTSLARVAWLVRIQMQVCLWPCNIRKESQGQRTAVIHPVGTESRMGPPGQLSCSLGLKKRSRPSRICYQPWKGLEAVAASHSPPSSHTSEKL